MRAARNPYRDIRMSSERTKQINKLVEDLESMPRHSVKKHTAKSRAARRKSNHRRGE